ncbi:MAG: IS5 family transposase, partial [Bacteroides sp.]|nr:IS5 family transposase [Bacteroides sp.]
MKRYSTNLTDKQWQVVEKILNRQERKRKYTLRDIMNAIFYTLKSGCQWCMLPKDFAPWQSVYFYFSKWKNEGIIEELLDTLRSYVCKMIGRNESPSLGIIDSRSVKSSHHVDADRGLDDNKKIKGRKQHIVVDTHGFPIAIAIHQAN